MSKCIFFQSTRENFFPSVTSSVERSHVKSKNVQIACLRLYDHQSFERFSFDSEIYDRGINTNTKY